MFSSPLTLSLLGAIVVGALMGSSIDTENADLQPLPVLPVIRTTYCAQEIADNCISFIQVQHAPLIRRLIYTSQEVPENFPEVLEKVAAYLQEEATHNRVIVPDTYIGMIDLLFELSRRFETVYGWPWPVSRPVDGKSPFSQAEAEKVHETPYFRVAGKPLTDTFNPPLPPLPTLAISKSSEKRGVTQAEVDALLPSRMLKNAT